MNMKTSIFAAALLQAVSVSAQAYPEFPEVPEDIFGDWEDKLEEGLTVEELMESAMANDVTQIGYFRSDDYQSQTAVQKLDDLWRMLVPDASNHDVAVKPLMWKEFDNFFTQKANGPFCDSSDELRKRRKKTTHTQGLVAKIEWKPVRDASGNTRFTGLYEEGTSTAIIRLSETKNLTSSSKGLLPSFAIKFLLDGHKSENLFAMPNFTGKYINDEGQEYSSWDFFHGTFKSRVEPFQDQCHIKSMEQKFLEANNRPYMTSVARPAYWSTKKLAEDGVTIETVPHYQMPETTKESKDYTKYQFPFELHYEGVHKFVDADRDSGNWYDMIKTHFNDQCNDVGLDGHCAQGVPLLNVYALTAPLDLDDLNGNPRQKEHIATIELKTNLYTSEEGDNRLFFQHIRGNKDYRHFPNWWKRNTKAPSDFPDFNRVRVEKAEYSALEGLTFKDDHDTASWPWPSNDTDAEAKYLELESTGSGCPFSWLFSNGEDLSTN